jgi:hypothetical protein
VIKRIKGGRELVILFAVNGSTLEWHVDWGRKVMLGQVHRDAAGAVMWEDAWTEVRQAGYRWLMRRVRTDRTGAGVSFVEQYAWDPDPQRLVVYP